MQIEVSVNKTCTVEATSEMELMGKIPLTCEGTWMIEGNHSKKVQVMVARAVVAPTSGMVPLRVLNVESEPVTLYKGMRIAKAEQIETSEIIGSTEQQLHTSHTDEEWDQILNKMIERIPANLNDHQAKQFLMVLTKYVHIFADNPNDLGRTNVLSHCIETTGSPIRQGVRRVPLPQRENIKRLLKEMQEKDIVTPSKSPWASPIVLVPKKDGTIRFCVDYRKVNEVTLKDAYPIPRVDDTLDTLAGSKWFSTLDLKSGYWQVEIRR